MLQPDAEQKRLLSKDHPNPPQSPRLFCGDPVEGVEGREAPSKSRAEIARDAKAKADEERKENADFIWEVGHGGRQNYSDFGRVLAAAGALQSGQLLNLFHEDYSRMCSIISLVYLVGLVLIWFCPETKGQALPD